MTAGSVSPRRADTRRNNERIIAAAKQLLTCNEDLAYNAIAKKAEVGVGTVYRHFPTQDSLVLAVYQSEVQSLVEAAATLLRDNPPDEAFRVWASHLARYMMTKRGLGLALHAAKSSDENMAAKAYESIVAAVATLLDANVAAGTIRDGIDPRTILRATGGLIYLDPRGDWKAETEQLFDLLWNGMHGE
nr:TetR/AcrR family transcriptional regulator [Kibdelosporangium sp. MJ126-NF4]CEL18376.1 FIG01040142: hypothetical protein [Kibdelosporangium sp. MJ126-NF4]CTQ97859.1 FIG01040142: hypothetical protein [Kibdelosporangium sp. MJ126-NF4]